jgi:hypothetical protein
LLFRTLASIALFFGGTVLAGAQEGDVRVILPYRLDDRANAGLERVDPAESVPEPLEVSEICNLIAASADESGIPKSFFARLIWRESRFDQAAESHAGAQGIAQFIPATALRRGLRDAFDAREAIPASAAYLADLRRQFGNLGLAAAAYNAGEERVSGWLSGDRYLPLETENYVLAILGKPAASFREREEDEPQRPLSDEKPFGDACRALPDTKTTPLHAAAADIPPWGVQVAGHFDRAVAMRKWESVRARHASLIGEREPAVFATKSAIGRKRLHVVQIAAASKREAADICSKLRIAGGSCIVVRN